MANKTINCISDDDVSKDSGYEELQDRIHKNDGILTNWILAKHQSDVVKAKNYVVERIVGFSPSTNEYEVK